MNNTGFTKTEQIVTTPNNTKGGMECLFLTFESLDEILKCVNSNKSYEAILFKIRFVVFQFSKNFVFNKVLYGVEGLGWGRHGIISVCLLHHLALVVQRADNLT